MIKGKSPEEIRKLFNIVNDFTPEEEVSPISRFAPIFVAPHVSDLLSLLGSNQEGERVGRGPMKHVLHLDLLLE
jgi:Skp1 family, dimerisation domain